MKDPVQWSELTRETDRIFSSGAAGRASWRPLEMDWGGEVRVWARKAVGGSGGEVLST